MDSFCQRLLAGESGCLLLLNSENHVDLQPDLGSAEEIICSLFAELRPCFLEEQVLGHGSECCSSCSGSDPGSCSGTDPGSDPGSRSPDPLVGLKDGSSPACPRAGASAVLVFALSLSAPALNTLLKTF